MPFPPPRDILGPALDNFTFDQTEHSNELIYGNREGISLIQRLDEGLHEIEGMKERLESETKTREKERDVTDKKIAALENRVMLLSEGCKGYYAIRNRFLDKYRKDRLGMDSEHVYASVRAGITAGNKAAHEPDVVINASLYADGYRLDRDTFLCVWPES
jgi:hypothetical protein